MYTTISLGHGKILVGLGDNVAKLSDFEVVDFRSPFSECSKLTDFPFATEGAVGGLGPQDQPVVCGGSTYTEDCFILKDGKWTPGIRFTNCLNLILKRSGAIFTELPTANSSNFSNFKIYLRRHITSKK